MKNCCCWKRKSSPLIKSDINVHPQLYQAEDMSFELRNKDELINLLKQQMNQQDKKYAVSDKNNKDMIIFYQNTCDKHKQQINELKKVKQREKIILKLPEKCQRVRNCPHDMCHFKDMKDRVNELKKQYDDLINMYKDLLQHTESVDDRFNKYKDIKVILSSIREHMEINDSQKDTITNLKEITNNSQKKLDKQQEYINQLKNINEQLKSDLLFANNDIKVLTENRLRLKENIVKLKKKNGV